MQEAGRFSAAACSMPWHFPRFPAGMQAKVPAQTRQRLLTSSSFLPVRHAGNRPLSILPTVAFPPLADQLHIFPSPEQHPTPGRTHSQNANPLKKEKASGKNPAKNRVLSGYQRNLTGI
ncbi:hypothetical protein C5N97_08035 [Akkermansia muciniphila]|nr:hypothetical protein C5N97_08035 [Akkermansia muciniphila]